MYGPKHIHVTNSFEQVSTPLDVHYCDDSVQQWSQAAHVCFPLPGVLLCSHLQLDSVPASGKISASFFFPFCLSVVRSLFLETRLIDMELHYPFLYFSLDDILLLISCILTQQRIVFLSSSYSLLTPIIEVCIVSLRWILRIGLSLQPLLIKLCTFAFQGAFN